MTGGRRPPRLAKLARLLPERGPRRVLAAATFVNNIGNGTFMTGSALYLTRSAGLSPATAGLGLSIGTLIGMAAGLPSGSIADRRGPREAYAIALGAEAVAMLAFVVVHGLVTLIPVACASQLAAAASQAARGPLIRGFGEPVLVSYRSYLRSVTNLAIAIGALAAGFLLQIDTRAAYLVLIAGNALTFAGCAAVVLRLPHLPPVSRPASWRLWTTLSDRPFVLLTVLNGILGIQYAVGTFAVPLWIVADTAAPRWTISATMIVNTAIVVLLQVPFSRKIDNSAAAGRFMRRAGCFFLAGFALIALTTGLTAWLAVLILLVATAIATIGEIWQAGAGFQISFGLAPAHAQGEYSAVFSMGLGAGTAIAPSLLSLVCLGWGLPGWLALGGLMVAAGLAAPPAVVRAEARQAARQAADPAPSVPGKPGASS